MENEYDEKNTEEASVELSLDDLEEASGGYVVDMGSSVGDGRYRSVDDFSGLSYTFSDNLEIVQRDAKSRGFFTDVITTEEYQRRFGRTYREK